MTGRECQPWRRERPAASDDSHIAWWVAWVHCSLQYEVLGTWESLQEIRAAARGGAPGEKQA